ncbi:hypothetical protein IJH46_00040 [Candidatus Saccharibacteria bacterium]|nr:hypothetical protein [Candidatus Saccharibacteria bacterium]
MNKFQKILTGLAVFAVSVLSGALRSTPVEAAGAVMKISPVANGIYIEAGKTQNYQFTLENTGENDFKFKLYTAPYNVINEDYDVDFSTETNYNQITRWITFQDDNGSFVANPTYSLKAGEKKTIIYRVKVPDDIPEGGQYCIIFAESITDSETETGAVSVGLGSVSRVSLIILGHGDGETKDVEQITDFSLTGIFSAHNIDASARVKNTGNTDFLAVYSLAVDSLFGTPLYSSSDNFVVLPQTERRFSTSWAEAPLFGIFKVKFSVTAIDQQREESHVVLIMPALAIILLLLLLTSIVVWTIILLRKRKERSSRLVV